MRGRWGCGEESGESKAWEETPGVLGVGCSGHVICRHPDTMSEWGSAPRAQPPPGGSGLAELRPRAPAAHSSALGSEGNVPANPSASI